MRTGLVVSLAATSFDAVAMRGGLEALDRVAALGYDGVEIAVRDPHDVDPAALAQRCITLNLPVVAIGTGQAYLHDGLSLAAPDPDVRRAAVARLRAHLRLAHALEELPSSPSRGVPVIVGLLRGTTGGDRMRAEAFLSEGIEACLDGGRGRGGIVIEAINRYETDYLHTTAEVAAFIERVDHPLLGLLADTFHMNIEERSIEGSLTAAAKHLRHVHVADSNRRAPGEGHLDFRPIVAALDRAGYEGYLSAEILPYPDEETAASRAILHVRGLLSPGGHARGKAPSSSPKS